MKKKILFITVLLTMSLSATFADFGIGSEIGFEGELFYKPYLRGFTNATFRSDENPWCFSVNMWPFETRGLMKGVNRRPRKRK